MVIHNFPRQVEIVVVVIVWFSPGTPVSSTTNTDRHDITEILLKVALNTIRAAATKWNDQPGPTSTPNNKRTVDKSPNVPVKKYR
jgi:hypothetical protein